MKKKLKKGKSLKLQVSPLPNNMNPHQAHLWYNEVQVFQAGFFCW